MLITVFSGLSFETTRSWRLGDRKVAMDAATIKAGRVQLAMLDLITGRVLEPGPYAFGAGGQLDWRKVCHADITDALYSIRAALKPVFDYEVNCPSCGCLLPLSTNLRDADRVPLSADGLSHLKTGIPITVEIEPGLSLRLRLLLGEDLPTIARGSEDDMAEALEIQQCLHVLEIHAGDNVITRPTEIRRFYQNSDYRFHKAIERTIDGLGGGINTRVPVTCRKCRREARVALPLDVSFYCPELEPLRPSTDGASAAASTSTPSSTSSIGSQGSTT